MPEFVTYVCKYNIMVNPPSSSTPAKSGWLDLINESVHTSEDEDIEDIHAIETLLL